MKAGRYGLLIAAILGASAASAAPLCRDAKGLFTPCPRAANSHARTILTTATPKLIETPEAMPPSPHAHANRPTTGDIQRAKLCRDTKGLFTPCPR